MFFVDDVVLIDENMIRVDQKFELWGCTLELKGFKLSRTKIEYIRCYFSGDSSDDGDVSLDRQIISMNDIF
jgi:hypothetical protein